MGGHVIRCELNPGRTYNNGHLGKKASPQRKKALSASMRQHFEKNPDKIPYRLYHSSKRSNPELVFAQKLLDEGVEFEAEFQHGIYTYDFAIINRKLDVEIDGSTHNQPHVQEIDRRRDAWSIAQGWSVLRIPATLIRKDINEAFALLKAHL